MEPEMQKNFRFHLNDKTNHVMCDCDVQGRCKWKSVTGKLVTLEPTTALSLSEVERVTLQEVALEKLRALNLGVEIKIPKGNGANYTHIFKPNPTRVFPPISEQVQNSFLSRSSVPLKIKI